MINKIILKNFKCFKDETTFKTNKLNLLTGINGRGKSSLLQSILLITQSNWNIWETTENLIFLNSSYIELGSYGDIKNSYTTQRDINIGFDLNLNKETSIKYVIKENEQDSLKLNAELFFEKQEINIAEISSFFKNKRFSNSESSS